MVKGSWCGMRDPWGLRLPKLPGSTCRQVGTDQKIHPVLVIRDRRLKMLVVSLKNKVTPSRMKLVLPRAIQRN